MKKLILILTIFLVGEMFGQVTSPSSYTTNYRFRKWVQGANPSADSINANWDDLDTKIKLVYDSAQTKINTYDNQVMYGSKYIGYLLGIGNTGYRAARFLIQNWSTTPTLANELAGTSTGYLLYFGTGATYDTIATLRDIRSGAGGYATLAGTESFTGAKTFDEKIISTDDVLHTRETINVGSTSFSVDGVTFGYLIPDTPGYIVTTINGGANGKIVYLVNSTSDYVTLDDGTGNLQLAGDFTMDQYDAITLIYDSNSSQWIELSRSNN